VSKSSTFLESNGCRTTKQVEMTTCEGNCRTSSVYSMQAKTVQHSCSCCQELATSKKEAELLCPDGSTAIHSYIFIEKCGCLETECTVKETAAGRQQRRRRWSRLE
uniref:CTCK domain-containing protein n=2 Tax=Electrophorus electricus TaxID=8005 RepID=A0A4W4E6S9_ELEEL